MHTLNCGKSGKVSEFYTRVQNTTIRLKAMTYFFADSPLITSIGGLLAGSISQRLNQTTLRLPLL